MLPVPARALDRLALTIANRTARVGDCRRSASLIRQRDSGRPDSDQGRIDSGMFIRSMATVDFAGGLSRTTAEVALLLDAAGKEKILIETGWRKGRMR